MEFSQFTTVDAREAMRLVLISYRNRFYGLFYRLEPFS